MQHIKGTRSSSRSRSRVQSHQQQELVRHQQSTSRVTNTNYTNVNYNFNHFLNPPNTQQITGSSHVPSSRKSVLSYHPSLPHQEHHNQQNQYEIDQKLYALDQGQGQGHSQASQSHHSGSNLTSESHQLNRDKTYQLQQPEPLTSAPSASKRKSKKANVSSDLSSPTGFRRRSHSVDHKPYTCDLCEKAFSAKWNLDRHVKEAHEGVKRERPTKPYENKNKKLGIFFNCEVCNKPFNHRGSLSRHVRCHYDDRPYSCDYMGCDRSFVQKSDLNRHRTVHTGDKPFPCDLCDKSFTQSTNLARHLKYHETLKEKKIVYGRDMHLLKDVVDYKMLHDMEQGRDKPSEGSFSTTSAVSKSQTREKLNLDANVESEEDEDSESDYSDE